MRSRPHRCDDDRVDDRDDDRGMVSAFVVIFASALVLVTALVVDGGRMLADYRRVDNLADSAARAGAQAIDDDLVRAGSPTILDDGEATAAACAFLARAGNSCAGGSSVMVDGNSVTVEVRGRVDLLMLPGVDRVVSGRGTACAAVGIADATC